MPLFGPPNICKLVEKRDMYGLLKALDYSRSGQPPARLIRADAAKALGSFKDSRVVEALIERWKMTSEAPLVRISAVEALTQIGGPRVVEALVRKHSVQ